MITNYISKSSLVYTDVQNDFFRVWFCKNVYGKWLHKAVILHCGTFYICLKMLNDSKLYINGLPSLYRCAEYMHFTYPGDKLRQKFKNSYVNIYAWK